MTRLTSVALIPLTLWFVVSLVRLVAKNCNLTEHYPATENLIIACGMATGDPDDWISINRPAHDWAAYPANAFLLILLTVLMFMHAASGMQAVFEDYIHKEGRKLLAIYSVKAICLLLGGACVLSILKIALGHP
jgi:succinate dehydrogenase / fumarate reductase membrane anchor subunit